MKRIACLAVAAAVCAVAAPAHAEGPTKNSHFVVKGGLFIPTGSQTEATGKNWLVAGLEYQLGDPNGRRVISVEGLYTAKKKDVDAPGALTTNTKYRDLILNLNYKIRSIPPSVAADNVFFYGAGVGLNDVRVQVNDPNPGGTGNTDRSSTLGGANLFIGYEYGSNLQFEAKYNFVFGEVSGRKLDGVLLTAGLKF